VIEWYASIGALWLWAKLSPRRSVLPYQIQKFRDRGQWRPGAVGGEPRYPQWFGEDFDALVELLRAGKIHPVVAERLPLAEGAARARAAGDLGIEGETGPDALTRISAQLVRPKDQVNS
jgi:hypothetical protein